MEYLVMLFLILVAANAYIESSKNKSNKKWLYNKCWGNQIRACKKRKEKF